MLCLTIIIMRHLLDFISGANPNTWLFWGVVVVNLALFFILVPNLNINVAKISNKYDLQVFILQAILRFTKPKFMRKNINVLISHSNRI